MVYKGCGYPCGYDCNGACFNQSDLGERTLATFGRSSSKTQLLHDTIRECYTKMIIIDDPFLGWDAIKSLPPQAEIPDWKRTIPVKGGECTPDKKARLKARTKRKRKRVRNPPMLSASGS